MLSAEIIQKLCALRLIVGAARSILNGDRRFAQPIDRKHKSYMMFIALALVQEKRCATPLLAAGVDDASAVLWALLGREDGELVTLIKETLDGLRHVLSIVNSEPNLTNDARIAAAHHIDRPWNLIGAALRIAAIEEAHERADTMERMR
jgi:hypothetical protein